MSPTPQSARPGRRPLRLAAVLLPLALLSAGCSARDAYENTFSLGFPDPATKQAQETYDALYRRVYRKMYDRLRPLYEEIRAITGYPARL